MKTLALLHPDQAHVQRLLPQFQTALPDHRIVLWAADTNADYLVTWKPHQAAFDTPNLQVIFGLGAGVDAFLSADIATNIPVVRLEEAGMGKQMLEIALYAVLHYSRDMIALNRGQRQSEWLHISTPKKLPFSTAVGVMGLGQLGGFIAAELAALGYTVYGYSHSAKQLTNVTCFADGELQPFLARSEVLINLLPLTPQTENILNQDLFRQLPRGAYVVNIARGKHLVEADLIPALDSGQLSGAFLDVFRQEPLPATHPFWQDDRITITPHLAAITLQDEAVKQISRNILTFENGGEMTGMVDRTRGY